MVGDVGLFAEEYDASAGELLEVSRSATRVLTQTASVTEGGR